jgi:hypothetical protein
VILKADHALAPCAQFSGGSRRQPEAPSTDTSAGEGPGFANSSRFHAAAFIGVGGTSPIQRKLFAFKRAEKEVVVDSNSDESLDFSEALKT